MTSGLRRHVVLTLCLLPLVACMTAPARLRKSEWAQPIQATGLPNLYRVDANLYRSANPVDGAAESLKHLGIRTVIDLRVGSADKSALPGDGPLNERIPMLAWQILDRDVVAVLKILSQRERGPFLVHCQQGADRTGLIIAIYRMVIQGWSKDAALEEMVYGGYGFHLVWQNIVAYLNAVDVEKLRTQLTQQS